MKTKKVQGVVETVQFSNSEKVFGASLQTGFEQLLIFPCTNIHALNKQTDSNRAMDKHNVPSKYSAV
jgi:hypothetical protein